ncbi:MAG: chemotaxis protein CheZ [Thiomicrorhabdus sp.]|nr:MAG: chemotaxis protein CheZ [Thiomicrorhabdus sp.]
MTFSTEIDKNAVKALLDALESGEQSKAVKLLDELTQLRESELYLKLSVLTEDLHHTLDGLSDQSLLLQTKHDIPDANERLEYVIQTTADASNQTLELAEKSISLLLSVERDLNIMLPSDKRGSIENKLADLGVELQNIMLAQSFQDLTGQVLNRVTLILSLLEQSLIHLIDKSKHDYDAIPDRELSSEEINTLQMRGIGPNVTLKSKHDSAQSQDDVDDLLADLGI